MDLLIKSFNRPYYLDRCIQSIYLNSAQPNFKIKILDDGTPQKYLDKIKGKYPDIEIYHSEFYAKKVAYTEKGCAPKTNKIPINLWLKAASEATDYFVLLEDDMWFVESFDLNDLKIKSTKDKLLFVKLFWLGNNKLIQCKTQTLKETIVVFEPDLYIKNPGLYKFVFYKYDCFKIRKILKALKIHTFNRALSYYSIYSTAAVMFKKEYFLTLWNDHGNEVDEGLQLYNAVKYLNTNATKIAFAHTKTEIVKTGFLSSATNQFKNYQNVQMDMFLFNKTLNDAWLNVSFDVMQNYPNDLCSLQIESILERVNSQDLRVSEWKKWVNCFKNQFQSFGCKTE
ncbi:glycosyltransferase family protein [Flavobacterium laiguense]|uniref:Uncharacterized protein n=1 Tax=Flavobacterium laiguense TaxID=2169409 RepID=A0A2U1JTB6_9FLAO|nr:hypothetical protein [Flavobacterium laiguense]PWA08446.1 hypothetical protein DB891_11490 [Flavobacterium laiguense]